MSTKRIIPCLDIKNGRVVKGINFVNLIDAGDPAEQAKIYNDNGADEICFLDITASYEKRNILLEVVKKTTEKCFVPLTVGGGVRTIEDINNLLKAGADKVSINTAAVINNNLVKEAAEILGGKGGGGRKDFAQAGGTNKDKIEEAFKVLSKKIS